MKLRCIFVGVHNRGLQMLELFTHDSRFLPVALVDVSVDVCREITAVNGWGDLPGFDSLAPAVAQVEADAVVISTPSAFHGAYTRQALEAGLHVYVATPFTTDLEDAIALVELAADRRLAIVVDQQQKYGVTERTLTGWTREKRYGELVYAVYLAHRHRPRVGAFNGSHPHLWEQGCHDLNSLLAICGRRVERVTALSTRPAGSAYSGPTVTMAQLELAGGVPCHYQGTLEARAPTIEIRLEYERAAVRAVGVDGRGKWLELAEPGGAFAPVQIRDADDPDPPERFPKDSFYRAVTQGGRVADDGRENLITLAVIDALVRASDSGTPTSARLP